MKNKRKESGSSRSRSLTEVLLIEADDVAAVVDLVANGQRVSVKICLGARRAAPHVVALLEEKVKFLGGTVRVDTKKDKNGCWLMIEPPAASGTSPALVVA